MLAFNTFSLEMFLLLKTFKEAHISNTEWQVLLVGASVLGMFFYLFNNSVITKLEFPKRDVTALTTGSHNTPKSEQPQQNLFLWEAFNTIIHLTLTERGQF